MLNFVGAFISLKVAATVATGIVDAGQVTETIAFAGLLGAIAWNLITWWHGLPSSSSHALIGGVVGAMLAAVGSSAVKGSAILDKVVIPALMAPITAFVAAGIAIIVIYAAVRPPPPRLGHAGLPRRPDRLELAARPRPRHQRRPEDDGRDHPRARRPR